MRNTDDLMQEFDNLERLIEATREGIRKMENDNWEWKQNRRTPIKGGAKNRYAADGLATL